MFSLNFEAYLLVPVLSPSVVSVTLSEHGRSSYRPRHTMNDVDRPRRSHSIAGVPGSGHDGPFAGFATSTPNLGRRDALRRWSSSSDVNEDAAAQSRRHSLHSSLAIFLSNPKRTLKGYSRAYRMYAKRRKEKKARARRVAGGVSEGDGEASGHGSPSQVASASVDPSIPLQRDLSRRKRHSFGKTSTSLYKVLYASTNAAEFLRAKVESESANGEGEDDARADHRAALLRGAARLRDVTLSGRDGATAGAVKFALASHSLFLEEVFYRGRECAWYDAAQGVLSLPSCDRESLEAAVHWCLAGELPSSISLVCPSEGVARTLAQLDCLARECGVTTLGELTYRALRKLVNRRPVLACAIFDELRGQGPSRYGVAKVDSIEQYALDTLREMPHDTLLAGGVQWMREAGAEAVMQDQDMEVDEFYMFKILHAWAAHQREERLPAARRLARNIELRFIDPELLTAEVAKSGYFTDKEIAEAVQLINDSVADRDQSQMERVLVEGAGIEYVNGIYCRVEEELGLSEEEVLFVKETDDGNGEMGLYHHRASWHLALCMDYSNCFYDADADVGSETDGDAPPHTGWRVGHGGKAPAPRCTYLPVTRLGRGTMAGEGGGKPAGKGQTPRGLIAPNLEEMLDPTIAAKRKSAYFDRRHEEVAEKRTMTLEQMMHLPEDRETV